VATSGNYLKVPLEALPKSLTGETTKKSYWTNHLKVLLDKLPKSHTENGESGKEDSSKQSPEFTETIDLLISLLLNELSES
jgi:hypothetical protein